jgi:hypothetical protein
MGTRVLISLEIIMARTTKAALEARVKELEAELAARRQTTGIRVTADGVERLTPRRAAMLAAKAEAQRTGRVVTVTVSTR